jgi:hypothetical protein
LASKDGTRRKVEFLQGENLEKEIQRDNPIASLALNGFPVSVGDTLVARFKVLHANLSSLHLNDQSAVNPRLTLDFVESGTKKALGSFTTLTDAVENLRTDSLGVTSFTRTTKLVANCSAISILLQPGIAGFMRDSSVTANLVHVFRMNASPNSRNSDNGVIYLTEHPSSGPLDFALSSNYPNPFNPTTVITYQLPQMSQVTLRVFDMLGREVAVLVDETKDVGYYSATFDGSKLSSGVYFTRLVAYPKDGSKPFEQTKKMILTK